MKLFKWIRNLFGGSKKEEPATPAQPLPHTLKEEPTNPAKNLTAEDIVADIFTSGKKDPFLQELRAIPTNREEMEKKKKGLLQELKKLDTKSA